MLIPDKFILRLTRLTQGRFRPWLWTFLLAVHAMPAHAELLVFSGDGYMLGPVYHARDAAGDELRAAQDLATYLGMVSGYEWPLQPEPDDPAAAGIYVGLTRAAADHGIGVDMLEPDGIRWQVSGDKLFLLGRDGIATGFAVYGFLQEFCQVRWFMPGDLGEEVPRRQRLRLPGMDFIYNPPFFQRLLGASEREWRQRNFQRRLIPFNHHLQHIFPPQLIEEHPEWFPLVRGERVALSGARGPNPNLAHPGAAAHAAQWVADHFSRNPDALGVSLATTDSLTFDESDLTRQWTRPYRYFRGRPDYSDLVFTFTNRVAQHLWPMDAEDGGNGPGDSRHVTQLAYYWAENLPSFPLHPRVLPVLTSDRAQWFDLDYRENDQELIRRWAESDAELLGTWDYYEGSPYIIPRVYIQLTADSIRFLRDHRVRVFYAEGRPIWGFDVPRFWVASQLLWNPDASLPALLDEFFRRFYGPAREPMREFYQQCEDLWMQQPLPADWIKYFNDPGQAELFPPDVCARLEELLIAAETLASEHAAQDPQAIRFVDRVRLARDAFAVTRAFSEFYHLAKELGAKQAPGDDELAALDRKRDRVRSMEGQMHRRPGLLETRTLMDPSARALKPADAATLVLEETFGDELWVADMWGIDAALQPGIHHDRPGSWSVRMRHTEAMHLRRYVADTEDPARLRVEGSTHFSLFQWIPVEAGRRYLIHADVRGQVSPGGRVALLSEWRDTDGAPMQVFAEDRLPVGAHDWLTLALSLQPPSGAEWLYVGIKVDFQYLDDWIELGPVRVWEELDPNHETTH